MCLLLQSVVWETPSIKKGYLMESTEPGVEKGSLRLNTDGVNLQVSVMAKCSVYSAIMLSCDVHY